MIGSRHVPHQIFQDAHGNPVALGNLYRGARAFLVCGGPSATRYDLSLLNQRGCLVMAVNNAAALVRPNLWVGVDCPSHFLDHIWLDPAVLKFAPLGFQLRGIRSKQDGVWTMPGPIASECPGVVFYPRGTEFRTNTFLGTPWVSYGCMADETDDLGLSGGRSVMLAAIKILYSLGISEVYLVGVDLQMEIEQPYAFDQKKDAKSCESNNIMYGILEKRLNALAPILSASGMKMFRCRDDDRLNMIPHLRYNECVERATGPLAHPIDPSGWYG